MTLVTGKPSSIRQDVHASELLTMINSITDGVMAIRLDRKVTFFNRAAIEITGFSEQEALGTPCYEIFGLKPEDCVLVRTLESQKPILNHYADITIANGRRIQISVSTSVLRDEDGKISGAIETFRDMSLVEALRKELQSSYSFEDIIGHSKPMREIFKLLPIISNSDSSVLIEGESGTGKELVARALHNLSPRKGKPLVTVNCAAIPSTLLESELFGYKAGAFTGAKKDKSGRFSLADGGTLFLDEIGEIEPNIQVKLLRAIQEKEFEPLGSTKTEKADIRLISATNKNLSEDARTGKFRQDLFYRIKVVSLMIEPLRNRMEDVPVLVNYFISKFNKLFNKNISGISPSVMKILLNHSFPGNVRELENVIEHSFVLCAGDLIMPEHLPRELWHESIQEFMHLGSSLDDLESAFILASLKRNNFSRSLTAKELKIDPSTLYRKMKKYQMLSK
ncbi:MAG: sigma 54-interacting transcriptional regulator [Calditrichaeota bacterium]|nr:sigma 54-interacting transcriptional regulator [Calditrichota bacterium]MBT7616957.1 sigma 54-interacting transcriptional regulator [Calditrichota bacterium]